MAQSNQLKHWCQEPPFIIIAGGDISDSNIANISHNETHEEWKQCLHQYYQVHWNNQELTSYILISEQQSLYYIHMKSKCWRNSLLQGLGVEEIHCKQHFWGYTFSSHHLLDKGDQFQVVIYYFTNILLMIRNLSIPELLDAILPTPAWSCDLAIAAPCVLQHKNVPSVPAMHTTSKT